MVEGLDKIANLANFEEDIEADEYRRKILTVVAQTPVNSSIMNKRSLFEADGMDVHENIYHKNIKTHPQDERTISEEIFLGYSKKTVLFQKKSVQMHQYSFREESKAESSSHYKSKVELISSYADKEIQSSEETKNMLP